VCASCHSEGGDDGHSWKLDVGIRRTPMIANGVVTTAPFHWDGEMKDMGMIMVDVFQKRMGGTHLGERHVAAVEDFLGALPKTANAPHGDPASISRGRRTCATGARRRARQHVAARRRRDR
jgi:hypothetical protein